MPKITKAVVDRAKYRGDGKRRDVRWDSEITGFGLRVYPSGKKSYVFQYRTRTGRTRLLTIGAHGTLTPDQARARARKHAVTVEDGGDPLEERKAEAAASLTVKDFATTYLEKHAKPHRRSWGEDQRRIDQRIVPALGHLALADVKRSDVAALHADIGRDAPVEANRTVELLRAMLYKAEEWGALPEGTPNAAAKVKRFTERARDRYVLPSELPKLWAAIGAEPNVFVRAALRLYLLVGLRKQELLRARWSDIDLGAREWRVPKTKSNEPHVVPLSSAALEILNELPRLADNPHVFPGHKRGTHLVNIEKNWRTARAAAGLDDVTLHDLRRTVGSWLASSGKSLAIVGQVLGHAPGDVQATAVYARLARDTARDALEEHGERLLSVVNERKRAKKRGRQ